MLNQRLLESVSKTHVISEDFKAEIITSEVDTPDVRTEYVAPEKENESLMDWIESLTEDEIDGLADPYGYNLAEAEDW